MKSYEEDDTAPVTDFKKKYRHSNNADIAMVEKDRKSLLKRFKYDEDSYSKPQEKVNQEKKKNKQEVNLYDMFMDSRVLELTDEDIKNYETLFLDKRNQLNKVRFGANFRMNRTYLRYIGCKKGLHGQRHQRVSSAKTSTYSETSL